MLEHIRQRWLVISLASNMDGRAKSHTMPDKLANVYAAGVALIVRSGVSGGKNAELDHYHLWPTGPACLRFGVRHVLQEHIDKGVFYRVIMLPALLVLFPMIIVDKLLRPPLESSWSCWLMADLKGRTLALYPLLSVALEQLYESWSVPGGGRESPCATLAEPLQLVGRVRQLHERSA